MTINIPPLKFATSEASGFVRTVAARSALILSLASAACFSVPGFAAALVVSSSEAVGPAATAQSPGTAQPLTKDDLKVLATNGSKLLDTQIGDLTGEGKVAALVLLDHPADDSRAGEGASRTLLLVTRDAQGQLQTLAQNDKIVPCARCGGTAGDPYSYSRVAPGRFTVVTEGGSREHWWNEFNFKYVPKLNTWVLEKAVRGVTDTATGRKKRINLSPKTLGVVKLNDFDPSSLPQVKSK